MLKAIKQFFSPPVFPNDEAKTRLTKILYVLVIPLLIVITFSLLAVPFVFVESDRGLTTIVILTTLGVFVTIMVLAKRGYLREAGFLYVFGLWAMATLDLYLGHGASGAQISFYITITVTAGILLGMRWAIVVAILSSLIVLALAILEINGYPFPHLFLEPPLSRWFAFTINLILTLTPVYLILTGLSEALTRAQRENEQRKETEQLLRENERKFRDITDNIPGLVFQYTIPKQYLPQHEFGYFSYVSPRGLDLFDLTGDLSSPDWRLRAYIHPDDKSAYVASIEQAITNQSNWFFEGRLLTGQHDVKWVRAVASPISIEENLVYNGVLLDITERKQLEEQILQSQKMEALGKLAGGIAHDFNNMLTPILAYTDLVMMRLPENGKAHVNLQQIRKAAERAEGLTRQILAFSRRQLLEITVLNLNTVIEDLQKMLRRVIGENIELQIRLSSDLLQVNADKGQLEQVLVNLVINARDAMPQGGKLIIKTTNSFLDATVIDKHTKVQAKGRYVMLAVSDTGHGMDEEIQKKLFEPFFTTKEAGQGTGLGLATVFGIIKQHNGYIFVDSQPGEGTTFRIYLSGTEDVAQKVTAEISDTSTFYGNETVLVVEDESIVRQLVCEMLVTFGYHVLEAINPEEGLKRAASFEETIHLLLTDVIMPTMNGVELYQKLAAARPDLNVLYISGYTDSVIFQENILDNEVPLLQKPFTTQALLQKVRQVLS